MCYKRQKVTQLPIT